MDIRHCYECAPQAWNEGEMDGFATISETADEYAYTQFQPGDLPNYWTWASSFVLGDKFFASAQGPSFPNHLYTIAAQSGGARDNPRRQDLRSLTFGCDAPEAQLVEVYDAEGEVIKSLKHHAEALSLRLGAHGEPKLPA